MNRREAYIDVVAGIMISWMILRHCCFLYAHYSLPSYASTVLLGFYMPWFYYKSGFFYNEKSQELLFRRDTSKLLRYFVIYSVLGWFVWCVCGLMDGSLSLKGCLFRPIGQFFRVGCITGNGALWFLLSLFIVRQCSNLLIKHIRITPPILAVISFALAFMLYALGWYNYSWWFGNVFSGMCFFLLGYWLKDKERKRIVFAVSTIIYGFFICAYLSSWIDEFPFLYMHANKMNSGNYLLFYPMALAGIIMINNIFRILCKHIRFRLLDYVGRNSMNFYVTHMILLTLVTFVAKYYFTIDSADMLLAITVCASTLMLPLINETIKTLKKSEYFNLI